MHGLPPESRCEYLLHLRIHGLRSSLTGAPIYPSQQGEKNGREARLQLLGATNIGK